MSLPGSADGGDEMDSTRRMQIIGDVKNERTILFHEVAREEAEEGGEGVVEHLLAESWLVEMEKIGRASCRERVF